MNETLKNHALKITVGTVIAALIFIIALTWEASSVFEGMKLADSRQDNTLIELRNDAKAQRKDTFDKLDSLNEKFGQMRDSLIEIQTLLSVNSDVKK